MKRWQPNRAEYVTPSDTWPLLGVCGILLGATQHNNPAALFALAGLFALILYTIRCLRHQELLRATRQHHRQAQAAARTADGTNFQPANRKPWE